VVLSLHRGQLLHPPLFDLASGRFQCILRPHSVRVELFEQVFLPCLWLWPARTARQWPRFREYLKRRTEAGEIKVDAANSRLLKVLYFCPDGSPVGSTSSQ
jgi:hypothetical protein